MKVENKKILTAHDLAQEIVTIRDTSEVLTKQGLPYFLGISNKSSGSKNISMNIINIPPGGKAEPHYHDGFETGIYVLKGKVETRYGKNLEKSVVNGQGDFVFIPPYLPHQPINLSADKEAQAIVVRDCADEVEDVVIYQCDK